jgi:hypothetical protein
VPHFKIYHRKVTFRIRLPSQHGKDAISTNVCAAEFIVIIFCFISGIYELFFGKDGFFTRRKNILQFGNVFSFIYFLLELRVLPKTHIFSTPIPLQFKAASKQKQ